MFTFTQSTTFSSNMPDAPSKVSGNMTAAGGSVKETVGKAIGNESMQCQGAGQKAQGNAEVEAAKAKGYAQGTGEKMAGNVKSGNKNM